MQESTETRPYEFSTAVTEATVYTDRAMVTRQTSAQLEVGSHTIFLDNLPDNLTEDSIRVSGHGNAKVTIEDFKVHQKYYREVPESRIQTLMDQLEMLGKQRKLHEAEIAVVEDQKSFLKEIRVHTTESISHGFERRKPEIEEWRSTLVFLGEEANRLNILILEIEDKIELIDKDIKEINESLKAVASLSKTVRKQVQVAVEVEAEGDFTFEISYLIYNALWRPMYDARVDSNNKKVVLRYYGSVVQRTGEDWNDVQVILSTARPHIGGNAPELSKWALSVRPEYLEAVQALEMPKIAAAPAPKRKKMRSAPKGNFGGGGAMRDEAAVAQTQVISGQGASVLFTPQGRSDIPGDGSNAKLLVMEGEFGSKFKYISIPKLSNFVYLSSEIKNNTEFPLIPGPISIFLDNSYIGKSLIKELVTPDEEFELSLGVDEAIKVKHQLKKKFGDEKGLFNKSKVQQYSYQIDLNNQRDTEEFVIVRDQIPVSEDDDIKVRLDSIIPSENTEKKEEELPGGTLEWKVKLPARSKGQIEFSFTVSYGKDVDVQGL